MTFDFQFAWQILPVLVAATKVTILVSALSFGLALLLGLVLTLAKMFGPRPLSLAVSWALEFVRGTPLLIQIFFLYFALPEYGIVLPALATGVLALTVHYASYAAEIYRAGIEQVRSGQWEAAHALSLRPGDIFVRIILPQAIVPIVPALGNLLIQLFKSTPLLSAIAISELMFVAKGIGSETFRYVEPITIAGLCFLLVSLAGAAGVRLVERAMRRRLS